MDNLFLIIFFVSIVSLVIGLVKPTAFSRFIKGEITRKKIGKIFGIAIVASFVLFAITTDSSKNNEVAQKPVVENTQVIAENKNETSAPVVEKTKTATPTKTETKTVPVITPTPTPTATPAPQTDRASMLVILKANASTKWGDDFQMVKYEYDQQVTAYDWVVSQTKYPDIMAKAKQKWSNDFTMVKYEYNQQASAYEWVMAQTAYPDIMAKAKAKWGTDYTMVKYEYNNQVEAYKSL